MRHDDFRPDEALPSSYYQVRATDYAAADGFDRGHMCPSADRTLDQASNSATFLMSNIAPQAPSLNRGLWEDFEAYCREQANQGNEVYIYAGSYGQGGLGANGHKTMLANSRISVPARYFKIALILPLGSDDLSRITERTSIAAIDVPNSQTLTSDDWSDYCTSVSAIEKATNLVFWTNVNSEVAAQLKQKVCTAAKVTPPSSGSSTPTTPVSTSPPTSTTSNPTTPSPPSSCGYHNGKKLYKGPEGGCYYLNSKGNKTYVDRSECTC